MTKSEWARVAQFIEQEPMYSTAGDVGSILRAFRNVARLVALSTLTPQGQETDRCRLSEEWKIVPIPPTQDMVLAGFDEAELQSPHEVEEIYRAMLNAAPACSNLKIVKV